MKLKKYVLSAALLSTILFAVGCKSEDTNTGITTETEAEVTNTEETTSVNYAEDKFVKFFFEASKECLNTTNAEFLDAIESLNDDKTIHVNKENATIGPDSSIIYTITRDGSNVEMIVDAIEPVEGEPNLTDDYIYSIRLVFIDENTSVQCLDGEWILQIENEEPFKVEGDNNLINGFNKIQDALKNNANEVNLDFVKESIETDISKNIEEIGAADRPGSSIEDGTIINVSEDDTDLYVLLDKNAVALTTLSQGTTTYSFDTKTSRPVDTFSMVNENRFTVSTIIESVEDIETIYNNHIK